MLYFDQLEEILHAAKGVGNVGFDGYSDDPDDYWEMLSHAVDDFCQWYSEGHLEDASWKFEE